MAPRASRSNSRWALKPGGPLSNSYSAGAGEGAAPGAGVPGKILLCSLFIVVWGKCARPGGKRVPGKIALVLRAREGVPGRRLRWEGEAAPAGVPGKISSACAAWKLRSSSSEPVCSLDGSAMGSVLFLESASGNPAERANTRIPLTPGLPLGDQSAQATVVSDAPGRHAGSAVLGTRFGSPHAPRGTMPRKTQLIAIHLVGTIGRLSVIVNAPLRFSTMARRAGGRIKRRLSRAGSPRGLDSGSGRAKWCRSRRLRDSEVRRMRQHQAFRWYKVR